jgi:hypothetical protein
MALSRSLILSIGGTATGALLELLLFLPGSSTGAYLEGILGVSSATIIMWLIFAAGIALLIPSILVIAVTIAKWRRTFDAEIVAKDRFVLGEAVQFRAWFKGELKNGLFTCDVRRADGTQVFWPAYDTFHRSEYGDLGILSGRRVHKAEWGVPITKDYPIGQYDVKIGVWDRPDLGSRNTPVKEKRTSLWVLPPGYGSGSPGVSSGDIGIVIQTSEDALKAGPSEAPQLVTPQVPISQEQEIEVTLSGVSDLPVDAIRFDMIAEVSEPIDAFGVKIGYGYGAPGKWANLDIREVTMADEIPAGQPVGIRAIARNDIIRFTLLTCWARDHRISIRTVGREKPDFFTDIRFLSRFPEIYVQFLGVRSKMRRGYVMVFGGPIHDPVTLVDIESELGKRMVYERERLTGRTPTGMKGDAYAMRKEGWVEVYMTSQISTSTRQEVLAPF